MPWRAFLAPVGVTLAGGLVFYVLIVELSYVLDGIGVTATATVGLVSAAGSLATAVAAYLFPRLAKRGPAATIPAAFVLCGLGILVLAPASSVPVVVLGAVVTGFGNGLLLPALLTWALGSLTFAQRGRGTGIWTSALFIGQFASPLIVLALSAATTGLSPPPCSSSAPRRSCSPWSSGSSTARGRPRAEPAGLVSLDTVSSDTSLVACRHDR
ncbi:MFS transporter [Amycolatopsis mediterranei]|uniref:MFS transporter n=1 Tax=Amycolatopsis mediterranei TaxID=33910 RepID=UPI003433A89A